MAAPFNYDLFRKALITHISGGLNFPEIQSMGEANWHLNNVFFSIRDPIQVGLIRIHPPQPVFENHGEEKKWPRCPCCAFEDDLQSIGSYPERHPMEVLDRKRKPGETFTDEEFDILESVQHDGNEVDEFNRRKLNHDPLAGKTKRTPKDVRRKKSRNRVRRSSRRQRHQMNRMVENLLDD
jgi:hypothetical protein